MTPNIHIRFDWAIKKLLRQKANFEILEGFLSELLREDLEIIEVLESESNKMDAYDKQNRVDVLVKNSRDELVLIEVQNEREHDYFHRMAFGTSKLITQYLHEGEAYAQVKKVYSINIVYFNLGQGEDYIYTGTTQFVGLHKQDTLALSDIQIQKYGIQKIADFFPTYYVLKLNSFDDIARDTLDEWIYFLKNNEIKDSFRAKGIQKAKEMLRIDSLGPAERGDYDAFVKEQRIRQSEIESAVYEEKLKTEEERAEKERVIAEKEREKAEKQKAVAERNLMICNLAQHMPAEQIAQMTQLDLKIVMDVLSGHSEK
jgi:predicted transposase/invertase (TIGR01784 family)